MWFGTAGGVSRYDGKSFVNFSTKDGLAHNAVWSIHQDKSGAMWFGTAGGGVSKYDGKGKGFVNFSAKDGLVNNSVLAIHQDQSGAIWFGTAGGGVSRYDGKGFVNFTTKDGLADNDVFVIHQDKSGAMWVGTIGSVSRYDGKGFVNFSAKDGLANNRVSSIHQDESGVMWVVTRGGVSKYDGVSFVNFSAKDGLAHNNVWSIHQDESGAMWFGTLGGGVSKYDGKSFVNFSAKDGLADNYVLSIHQDQDGVMWFGTHGGVSRYDGKSFVNFTTKDGLAHNSVYAIHQDKDGVIWFGTVGGVSKYDGKGFVNFSAKDGLANNFVFTIHQDKSGAIWFGTFGGGVFKYDGKAFVNFSAKDGLANNSVRAIYQDQAGAMWFGTFGGACRYDGISWTSLDARDGLAGNSISSIHQDSDGFLWIGTLDGGITQYRKSQTIPSVKVVSIKTDKLYTDLSAIPPIVSGTRATIEYQALDFKTLSIKQQYRIRVGATHASPNAVPNASPLQTGGVNAEDGWEKPTKSTIYDWTPKKAGSYIFEVQAIDRDQNYSKPASLTLKVVLPFYLRFAFLIPTVGGGAILLTALFIFGTGFVKHRRAVLAYQRAAVEELQDARQMQMSLLPQSPPLIEGLEIAGRCISANTVGGDFFDYLTSKGKNQIGIVVADVTGKGLKGAMYAVMTDGILHTLLEENEWLPPASLMMKLNNVLKERTERDMNVTMVIGLIEINAESQTLTLANAGHHIYPIILRNGELEYIKAKGLPVGVKAGIQYKEEEFSLRSGDAVIFMTDGIIEAKDIEDKLYLDSGRLEKIISQFGQDMSSEAMMGAIIADAMDFGGSKDSRDDDMTVVVAKIR
jgi:serine phosphatase RsbU (regulator of sigma subunit)/ligand-binding sensor domain-containing protein